MTQMATPALRVSYAPIEKIQTTSNRKQIFIVATFLIRKMRLGRGLPLCPLDSWEAVSLDDLFLPISHFLLMLPIKHGKLLSA